MSPTRREVLAQLAALAVLPFPHWVPNDHDPLDGIVADHRVTFFNRPCPSQVLVSDL
jgi:hypothetical protein